MHFDISECPHGLVWAASIVSSILCFLYKFCFLTYFFSSGDATLEKIPLGSNFFKPHQAIKKKSAPAVPVPDVPIAPAAAPAPRVAPPGYPPYYSYPPFAYGMPPIGGAPHAWPGAALHDLCTSSPPAADPTMTTADFCALYGLDAAAEAGLDDLGFQVGDDLKMLSVRTTLLLASRLWLGSVSSLLMLSIRRTTRSNR